MKILERACICKKATGSFYEQVLHYHENLEPAEWFLKYKTINEGAPKELILKCGCKICRGQLEVLAELPDIKWKTGNHFLSELYHLIKNGEIKFAGIDQEITNQFVCEQKTKMNKKPATYLLHDFPKLFREEDQPFVRKWTEDYLNFSVAV